MLVSKLCCFRYIWTWFVITMLKSDVCWTTCEMDIACDLYVESCMILVVCWLVWNPSWFHRTTGFIWAQVWQFNHFGDCHCTCALINWMVLLHQTRAPIRASACSHFPDQWLQRVSARRPTWEDYDMLSQPLEGHGALDDQMAPSQSLALLITRPMIGSDQKGGHPRSIVGDSQTSLLSSRLSWRPMRHGLVEGSAPSLLSLSSWASSITLEKKAPSRTQHTRRWKPSPTRRVRSLEDQI
jgi:hypothetical protein